MTKLIYAFTLTSGIVSCYSDDDSEMANSKLIGKLNLIEIYVGFPGCLSTTKEDFGILEFSNNLYSRRVNDEIVGEMTYSITDNLSTEFDIFLEHIVKHIQIKTTSRWL